MARTDREELQAFAKKMHDEGAAGFAAGLTPWETWDDFEDRVGSRVWQGTAEHVADQGRPTHSFGDRVITAMTLLAVATLAVGIAGVYVSRGPAQQMADNSTPLPSGSPAIAPETDPATEVRVALNDVSLPTTPVSQISGSSAIDTATGPSGGESINGQGDDPKPAVPADDDNMLAALDEPPAAAAAAMPVAPATGQTDALDSETAAPAVPADDDNMLATLDEPPAATAAAMPVAPATGQTDALDSETAAPAAPADDDNMLATLDEPPAAAAAAMPVAPPAGQTASLDSDTAVSEAESDNSLMIAALNELPAPAAGMAPDRPSASTPTETSADREPVNPEATTAKPGNNAPVQPTRLAQSGKLDVHTELLQAPDKDIKPGKQSGDWSINLASYSKHSTAEKMSNRFLEKGVPTDLFVATVKGKTYYRLRVRGFESRQAALTQSTIIKEQLGLKEAWITKE